MHLTVNHKENVQKWQNVQRGGQPTSGIIIIIIIIIINEKI